ncbi:MAG: cupin domain-containing protein, partial [Elusimicrobiales bacterium]|nr:cupin domain-containing protein [Elusimicrobiales bacterium]
KPLPDEGGYFRETYRSKISAPVRFKNDKEAVSRNLGIAIYYLVTPDSFSALHKVKSDEMFHFYAGDPVEIIQIFEGGKTRKIIMGSDFINNQEPQVLVSAGVWQGTRLQEGGKWALLGTTVAPGFEFIDFELGNRNKLLKQFPNLKNEILKYA